MNRVKVRDDAAAVGFASHYRGCEGTVTEERKYGTYDVRVQLDGLAIATWFKRSELEALEELA